MASEISSSIWINRPHSTKLPSTKNSNQIKSSNSSFHFNFHFILLFTLFPISNALSDCKIYPSAFEFLKTQFYCRFNTCLAKKSTRCVIYVLLPVWLWVTGMYASVNPFIEVHQKLFIHLAEKKGAAKFYVFKFFFFAFSLMIVIEKL